MSKVRQNVPETAGDLAAPPERDMIGYVVFTRLKADGPFVYAGWLDAADDAMALGFAREHYGQDQKCVGIWVAPRMFVGGLRINDQTATEPVPRRSYRIFTQPNAGDPHVSSIAVEATCAADAIAEARRAIPGAETMHNIWAIPEAVIAATDEGDLIWRYTDQSYRLARGYSKDVRAKWERIRDRRSLDEYEKEELTEAF